MRKSKRRHAYRPHVSKELKAYIRRRVAEVEASPEYRAAVQQAVDECFQSPTTPGGLTDLLKGLKP